MMQPFAMEHDWYLERYLKTKEAKIIGKGRELIGLKKDKTMFPFFLTISEALHHGEHIFTGIIHDLTEIRLRNGELKKAKESYQDLFNLAPGPIIIHHQGDIELVNNAISKLYGYKNPEDMLKLNTMKITHPDDRAILKTMQKEVKEKGKLINKNAIRHQRKDGSYIYVSGVATIIMFNGRDCHYVNIIHCDKNGIVINNG